MARVPTAPGLSSSPRLYLQVADEILRSVALGVISVGQRLPNERELAQKCNVSRATVREALLALELSGVVEVRRGSGCYLAGLELTSALSSARSIDVAPRDLLEVRRALEPLAARLCAEHAGTEDLAQLDGLLAKAAAVPEDASDADLDAFVSLNLAFHRHVARLSGNLVMADVVGHLVDAADHRLWVLVDRMAAHDPGSRRQQLCEHRQVFEAIACRRPEMAVAAMSEHLKAMSDRIFGSDGVTTKVVGARRKRR